MKRFQSKYVVEQLSSRTGAAHIHVRWWWYNPPITHPSIHPSIHPWLHSPMMGLGRFFSFLIFNTVGKPPLTGNKRVARPLPAHRTAQTQNKRTQTSMPRVGLECTIPVFERGKTVHALDRTHCKRRWNEVLISKRSSASYQQLAGVSKSSHWHFMSSTSVS
jgi:hypothetical protein